MKKIVIVCLLFVGTFSSIIAQEDSSKVTFKVDQQKQTNTNFSDIEEIDDVPLAFTSNMPYVKWCKDNESNMERNQCTRTFINSFIRDNIDIPEELKNKGIKGTVFIQFIISKTGNVKDVKVLKSVHPELDKACIEVVEKLPNFEPGKSLDKPVSVMYKIPIKIQ